MVAGARLGDFGSGRVLAIWLEGMGYIHEVHTRGFLPRLNVSRFVHDRKPLEVAEALSNPLTDMEAAQWGVVLPTPEQPESRRLLWYAVPGGWRVHDYDIYQHKAVEIVAKRKAAGRMGGLASGAARRAKREAQNEAQDEATSEANTKADASPDAQALLNPVAGTGCSFGATSTARLAPRSFPQAVEKPKDGKASDWKRVVAITHAVLDACPEPRDWTPEIKARCQRQGIDYGQPGGADRRPLHARALDYVEDVRRRRRTG